MKSVFITVLALFVALAAAQTRPPCDFNMMTGEVTVTEAYVQASLRNRNCRKRPFDALAFSRVDVATDRQFTNRILNRVIPARRRGGKDPRVRPGYYTARIHIKNLKPVTTYYYRFTDEFGRFSPVGVIKTLPLPTSTDEVHFVHISCANINPYPISGALRDYIKQQNAQFTIFNGDVIYADRVWLLNRKEPFNETARCCVYPELDPLYYIKMYEDQRDDVYTGEGFTEALYSAPWFMLWDDHEVTDDFAGNKGAPKILFGDPFNDVRNPVSDKDALRYTKFGRDAFYTMNALPTSERLQRDDPVKVPQQKRRIFRKFKVGKDVEIIMLDLRSYREPLNYPDTRIPVKPIGVPDNFSCTGRAPSDKICGELPEPMYDPHFRRGKRTLLGKAQKAWFKRALKSSTAKFKLVISSVMIIEFFYNPPDRWEGYWSDRREILNFIQANMIRNVVFLTGDYHCSIFGRVNPGKMPPVYEVTTGSVGALLRGTDFIDWYYTYASNGHLFPESQKPTFYMNTIEPNFMSVKVKNGKLTIKTLGTKGQVVTDLKGNPGVLELQ